MERNALPAPRGPLWESRNEAPSRLEFFAGVSEDGRIGLAVRFSGMAKRNENMAFSSYSMLDNKEWLKSGHGSPAASGGPPEFSGGRFALEAGGKARFDRLPFGLVLEAALGVFPERMPEGAAGPMARVSPPEKGRLHLAMAFQERVFVCANHLAEIVSNRLNSTVNLASAQLAFMGRDALRVLTRLGNNPETETASQECIGPVVFKDGEAAHANPLLKNGALLYDPLLVRRDSRPEFGWLMEPGASDEYMAMRLAGARWIPHLPERPGSPAEGKSAGTGAPDPLFGIPGGVDREAVAGLLGKYAVAEPGSGGGSGGLSLGECRVVPCGMAGVKCFEWNGRLEKCVGRKFMLTQAGMEATGAPGGLYTVKRIADGPKDGMVVFDVVGSDGLSSEKAVFPIDRMVIGDFSG